jgi:hypothetical protein
MSREFAETTPENKRHVTNTAEAQKSVREKQAPAIPDRR